VDPVGLEPTTDRL